MNETFKSRKGFKACEYSCQKNRQRDWNDVIRAIKIACSRGKALTSVYGANLTEADKQKLEEKGYIVSDCGTTWYIYWGEYDETQS